MAAQYSSWVPYLVGDGSFLVKFLQVVKIVDAVDAYSDKNGGGGGKYDRKQRENKPHNCHSYADYAYSVARERWPVDNRVNRPNIILQEEDGLRLSHRREQRQDES